MNGRMLLLRVPENYVELHVNVQTTFPVISICSVEAVAVGERVCDLHGREAVVRVVSVPTPLHLLRYSGDWRG